MKNIFEVGHIYKAKTYLESGYNFPEGEYKVKAKIEGFPQKPVNKENELKSAKEQWLEGYEDDEEEYRKLYKGIWYYLEFPEDDHYEWIPEIVMAEAFR